MSETTAAPTITATDRRRWRDPALGPPRVLELSTGHRLAYHEAGSGPTIVFVHGLLVNANLWRKVVARLAPDFRCIALDLPVGAHNLPLAPGVANGPRDVADAVAGALEALDVDDVTLVGNDSGGAVCQVVVTTRPERVGRLVLTSCDYRDEFPPKLFAYLKPAAAVPGLLWALLQPMRLRAARRTPIAFGWLAKRAIDRRAEDSYVLPAIADGAIRADARAFIKGARREVTNTAADRLPGFDRPALIAWSAEDRIFGRHLAERLAADLPDSQLELIEDARTFSMEDNPDRLAAAIAAFVREPVGGRS